MDMLQIIILGLVQAISEWVPLSSKTMDTIVYTKFFGGSADAVVPLLLFLHIGTMLAAIIYFRREIAELGRKFLSAPTDVKRQSESEIGFLVVALFFTGVVGVPILLIEKFFSPDIPGGMLLSIMGAGLIVTGFLLTSQHKNKWRTARAATWRDGILTGALQGLSILPGVSRAGTSTTALIWRGFDAESAFRLSFVLAIPTVFLAELVLYGVQGGISSFPIADGLALALSSLVFGYLTLDALLKIAHKTNVAWLAFVLGMIMVAAGLMGMG